MLIHQKLSAQLCGCENLRALPDRASRRSDRRRRILRQPPARRRRAHASVGVGQVLVDLELIVGQPTALLRADREQRRTGGMGHEPGGPAGYAAVAPQRHEQALDTVGAVDRAQQIEPSRMKM